MNEYIPHAITHHTKLMPLLTMTTSKSTDNFYTKSALMFVFKSLNFINFIHMHSVTIRLRSQVAHYIMFANVILKIMLFKWPENDHIIGQNM